jgi:hypothetical protein
MNRLALSLVLCSLIAATNAFGQSPPLPGDLQWNSTEPLLAVDQGRLPDSPDNPWHAVKDPTVVRFQDRWHLFCTLRKRDGDKPGYIRIGYIGFKDWADAPQATWQLLDLSPNYHAAPQVFYFAPQEKWYLIYQLADPSRGIPFGPCFSTNSDIGKAATWTRPEPLYSQKPDNVKGWLDFWVICDDSKAHLFFTSLNGKMWRAETQLSNFPHGFGTPQVVLQADLFEASHTYRVKDSEQFLTVVEAQGRSGDRGRRYFKAYVAKSLDGQWKPWRATADQPFAGAANVKLGESQWTDSISHGELIRSGFDQRLEVDPANLQFLFQGLTDDQWSGGYGRLGWRLGLLRIAQ